MEAERYDPRLVDRVSPDVRENVEWPCVRPMRNVPILRVWSPDWVVLLRTDPLSH
jgi:hypothetical protein